jgi:hypothetical protein
MTCTLAQSPKPFLKIQLEAFKKKQMHASKILSLSLAKVLRYFLFEYKFCFFSFGKILRSCKILPF